MKDPRRVFQTAAITAIEAALVAFDGSWSGDRVFVDPQPGQAYPYVVVTGSTVIDGPTRTKDGPGQELTMEFTAVSDSYGEGLDVADQVLQSLTDLSSPLTLTGYTVQYDMPDLSDTPRKDDIDPTDIKWLFPVRVRYIITQN